MEIINNNSIGVALCNQETDKIIEKIIDLVDNNKNINEMSKNCRNLKKNVFFR